MIKLRQKIIRNNNSNWNL